MDRENFCQKVWEFQRIARRDKKAFLCDQCKDFTLDLPESIPQGKLLSKAEKTVIKQNSVKRKYLSGSEREIATR